MLVRLRRYLTLIVAGRNVKVIASGKGFCSSNIKICYYPAVSPKRNNALSSFFIIPKCGSNLILKVKYNLHIMRKKNPEPYCTYK